MSKDDIHETIVSDSEEEHENEEPYDDGKHDRFSDAELAAREQEYNDLDIEQLREELEARNLNAEGSKEELVSRLVRDDFDHEEQDDRHLSDEFEEKEAVGEADEENDEEFVEWNKDGDHEVADGNENVAETASNHELNESHEEKHATEGEPEKQARQELHIEEGDLKAEEEAEFAVDVSKDKDLFYLKWHGKKITVPFKSEIVKDLVVFNKQQSVIVYPMELDDFYLDIFRKYMGSSINFSLEMDEGKPGLPLKGFLRLKFRTLKDASAAIDDLKSAKEGLTIKHFSRDDNEGGPAIMSQLRREECERKGPALCRLIYVGNVPNSVTETTLTEHFSDALQVIIPRDEETQERLGYAYLEYSNEEDAYEAAEKYKDMELDGEKLYIIKAIAEKKEKYGLLRDSLRLYWVDQIQRLTKLIDHSRDKDTWEVEEAEQKLHTLKRRLEKDRRRREVLRLSVPEPVDEKKKKEDKERHERSRSSRSSSRSPRPRRESDRKSSSYHRMSFRRSPNSRRETYRPSRGGRTYAPRSEDVANKLVDQLQGLVSALTDKLPTGESRAPSRRGYPSDSRYRGSAPRSGYSRSGYPRSSNYPRPSYSRSTDYFEDHRPSSGYQGGYSQTYDRNYVSPNYRGNNFRGGSSAPMRGTDRYPPVKRNRDDVDSYGPERKRRLSDYGDSSSAGRYPSSRPSYGDPKYSTDRRHPSSGPAGGRPYSRPRPHSRGNYSSAY